MTSRLRLAVAKAVGAMRHLYGPTRTERAIGAMRARVAGQAETLAGKRVLVTGSTRGIGRAIGEGFALAGARVVVHGRREDEAREVASALPGAIGFGGDLRQPGTGRDLVARAVLALGGLDVVINNAAIHDPVRKLAWQTSTDELMGTLQVNVVAAFEVSTSAIASMLAQGIPGRIVNISSRAGDLERTPRRGTASYSVSKVALEGLARCLAAESPGVVVTTLRPSAVQTDMTRPLFAWDQHALMLPPESMVAPVVFLATAEPGVVHGQVFDQATLIERLTAP